MIHTERIKNRTKGLVAKNSFAKTCISLLNNPPGNKWRNSKEAHSQEKKWKTIESEKTISQPQRDQRL